MKCHYVPQFYLKNFSIPSKLGGVYAYRRKVKPFETTTTSIAAKNDLYVFTDKFTGKKNDEIEKMFSWLEGLTAPIIEKINNDTPLTKLTNTEHNILSEFIAYLYVRNLSFREKQKNIASTTIKIQMEFLAEDEEKFKKALHETGHDKEDAGKMREYALNFDKHFKIDWGKKNNDYFLKQALLLALKISQQIFYKEWYIVDNQTSRVFITSDNPVILMRPLNLPPFYGLGILNSHIIVPTSPTKALLLRFTGNKPGDPKVVKANREFVLSVNRHTMFYAHKFIYSNLLSKDIERDFNMTEDGKSERIVVS